MERDQRRWLTKVLWFHSLIYATHSKFIFSSIIVFKVLGALLSGCCISVKLLHIRIISAGANIGRGYRKAINWLDVINRSRVDFHCPVYHIIRHKCHLCLSSWMEVYCWDVRRVSIQLLSLNWYHFRHNILSFSILNHISSFLASLAAEASLDFAVTWCCSITTIMESRLGFACFLSLKNCWWQLILGYAYIVVVDYLRVI